MGTNIQSQVDVDVELISGSVDVFYQKMLGDYRANRFFTTRTTQQQQA